MYIISLILNCGKECLFERKYPPILVRCNGALAAAELSESEMKRLFVHPNGPILRRYRGKMFVSCIVCRDSTKMQ